MVSARSVACSGVQLRLDPPVGSRTKRAGSTLAALVPQPGQGWTVQSTLDPFAPASAQVVDGISVALLYRAPSTHRCRLGRTPSQDVLAAGL